MPFLDPSGDRASALITRRASHMMSRPVVSLRCTELRVCIRDALESPHNGFPVVDNRSGVLRGIVTRSQINGPEYLQGADGEAVSLLRDMSTAPFAVHKNFPARLTYSCFQSLGLRHMLVVDDSYRVVGIITRKDLAAAVHHAEHKAAPKGFVSDLAAVGNVLTGSPKASDSRKASFTPPPDPHVSIIARMPSDHSNKKEELPTAVTGTVAQGVPMAQLVLPAQAGALPVQAGAPPSVMSHSDRATLPTGPPFCPKCNTQHWAFDPCPASFRAVHGAAGTPGGRLGAATLPYSPSSGNQAAELAQAQSRFGNQPGSPSARWQPRTASASSPNSYLQRRFQQGQPSPPHRSPNNKRHSIQEDAPIRRLGVAAEQRIVDGPNQMERNVQI